MATGNPIVTVKQGKLRGVTGSLLNGQPYYAFKGIPYATPPVGELRFKAPLPLKKWQDIRDATEYGAVCPQYDMTTFQINEGNEDCLFLNVYSKDLNNTKTPVMVFIHGGGFMGGSGDDMLYGPQFLLQHDIVLVTFNYRLEVLGFLSLDTPEVPGNAGLKDQVMALKWVKDNIDKFGGDPNNVTIFGESAGGASVAYHILSPLSKGLFHKAIIQSGTCLQDWAIASEPKARAFRVAKVLGKDTNNTDELLKFLRSVPATNLLKMTFKTATDDEKKRGLPMHFVPNVEKEFKNVNAFITENPNDIILANKTHKVPLIIGYTSGEGLLVYENTLKNAKFLNENSSFLVPREIARKVSEKQMKEFGVRILKFYTGSKGFGNDTSSAIVDMATDVHFGYQTHRFVNFFKTWEYPIYMYKFEYETDLNCIKNLLGFKNMKGACHADDLTYFFCCAMNKDIYNEQKDLRDIVDKLTKMWTDFAKTGNPTPTGAVQWKPFSSPNKEYLSLNEVMMMRQYADQQRVLFWNQLYCDAGLPFISKSSL